MTAIAPNPNGLTAPVKTILFIMALAAIFSGTGLGITILVLEISVNKLWDSDYSDDIIVQSGERRARCEVQDGADIAYRNDLDWFPNVDAPRKCCQLCVENPDCFGWTHNF